MVVSNPRLAVLLIALLAGPCLAAEPAVASPAASGTVARRPETGGPSWAGLTAQQRATLAPLATDWASIEPTSKSKWLDVATRFPAMPAGEQQRVQQRMAEWARMSPTERGRARLSFQESKQFTPEQKQARWEAYQALPDAQRRALADRAKPPSVVAKAPDAASAPMSGVAAAQQAASRPTPAGTLVKQVAPTLVQAKPGATTRLMTAPSEPPAHHHPGQPKIAAKPGQVDRSTLLPRSGPQAAAAASRPATP
jgi:hypothetical protein